MKQKVDDNDGAADPDSVVSMNLDSPVPIRVFVGEVPIEFLAEHSGGTLVSRQGQVLTNLNISAYWPDFSGLKYGASPDPADRITIILQPGVGTVRPDYRRDEASFADWAASGNMTGPHAMDEIGLNAYYDRNGYPAWFRPIDRGFGAPDGGLWLVYCHKIPSVFDECSSSYEITPDLRLKYRFSKKLLPNWRELDASVQRFVRSLMQEGN